MVDDDGDGFTEQDGDCDDSDADVNPYAPEDPDNDIDDDCDGEVDEVDPVTDDDDSAGDDDDDDFDPPVETGDDDDTTVDPPELGCACQAISGAAGTSWLLPLALLGGSLRRRRTRDPRGSLRR